jgi:hypothetical protein
MCVALETREKNHFFKENLTSDINILLETWKGDSDKYKVIGYNFISNARKKKKKARRRSGGIIIYFKKEFPKCITYLKETTLSQNILWLKLDKMFFGLSHDVYLCVVYIPPISSPHYDNDFISLEGEVSTFSSKGKIVLIGDFNSRTGENPDFIEKDSSQINDFDGVDLLSPDYVTDTELKRVNQDFIINSHGKTLLDLCSSSRLRILNGRFLGDSLDYFTYMSNNGFSSVDYAILSESLLPSVKYSKTNDFTYLPDHVQIELYLKCSITHETKTKLDGKKMEKYKNI